MATGRLEVITGPMFSGKTEELIRRLNRYQIAGKTVIVFSPEIDDRYDGVDKIYSHSGWNLDCVPIPVEGAAHEFDADVVAFDEAQFFAINWLLASVMDCVREGLVVIVSGLDRTYRGQPFGAMPYLLAVAEKITKLSAVCHRCGEDAYLTQRLIDGRPAPFSGETVVIGGLDSYEARCRGCFEVG